MIRSIAVLALILAAAGCSQTSMTSKSEMVTRDYAFAPPAFYSFCKSRPALCSTRGSAKIVKLNPAKRSQLDQVNRAVNRHVHQREDGGGDRWQVADAGGDCEDIAIRKKAELLKNGWPASALLLTVGTYRGVGHTVLTARTSDGDLILDSLSDSIEEWSHTPYKYFARQEQGDSENWTRITGARPLES